MVMPGILVEAPVGTTASAEEKTKNPAVSQVATSGLIVKIKLDISPSGSQRSTEGICIQFFLQHSDTIVLCGEHRIL